MSKILKGDFLDCVWCDLLFECDIVLLLVILWCNLCIVDVLKGNDGFLFCLFMLILLIKWVEVMKKLNIEGMGYGLCCLNVEYCINISCLELVIF